MKRYPKKHASESWPSWLSHSSHCLSSPLKERFLLVLRHRHQNDAHIYTYVWTIITKLISRSHKGQSTTSRFHLTIPTHWLYLQRQWTLCKPVVAKLHVEHFHASSLLSPTIALGGRCHGPDITKEPSLRAQDLEAVGRKSTPICWPQPTLSPLGHPGVEQSVAQWWCPGSCGALGSMGTELQSFLQALWSCIPMSPSGSLFTHNHLMWTIHFNEFLHDLFWWAWKHRENLQPFFLSLSLFPSRITDPKPMSNSIWTFSRRSYASISC